MLTRLVLALALLGQCSALTLTTATTPRAAVRSRCAAARMGEFVKQVNTEEFEEAIQDCSTPIVLDVFAVWCGPCQVMAPELEKVAEKMGDKVRFFKIDADEEPVVSETLKVSGLPTLMLINDMSVVCRAEGALMQNELEQLIDHHLFGGPAPSIDNLGSVQM